MRDTRLDYWVSGLVFCTALLIFVLSPLRSLGETQYTMMVAQTLLHQHTFALDRKALQLPDQLNMIPQTAKVKDRPLEVVSGRIYKYAPPGSSLLSLPFVAIAGFLDLAPTDASGAYNPDRELKLSAILAAFLMSTFAVVCFRTSRLLLSISWSVVITAAATLGTQVWSTASRVVEPDTWSILLMMVGLYIILGAELRKLRLRPVLLASLLSSCYLVQPTASISIVAITVYMVLYQWRYLRSYVVTGFAWFAAFLLYSWHNFGQVLPNYYEPSRLDFLLFRSALPGNLISPARGVLVFVPTLLFVAFILVRYWKFTEAKRLAITAVAVLIAHVLTISGFTHWWAGHSYGPRYWTSVVPWFVVSVASCDPSEFDPATPLGTKIRIWTDQTGNVVPTTIVREQADCYNATQLEVDGRLFVWDPNHGVAAYDPSNLEGTFETSTSVPATATDTGYRSGSRSLYIAAHGSAAYVGSGKNVQRWPHVKGDEVIRIDCN